MVAFQAKFIPLIWLIKNLYHRWRSLEEVLERSALVPPSLMAREEPREVPGYYLTWVS